MKFTNIRRLIRPKSGGRIMVLSLLALGAVGGTFGTAAIATSRERAAEADFPAMGQIIDVEGVKVHAHIEGSGPDLVMIHGAGGNLRDFTFSLSARLAADFRVIAFDRPGHGFTDRIPQAVAEKRGESPREQARLLQAAAAQIGVSDALVLGQSFGGAVAMAWALENPKATNGLIIISGATMPWPGDLKQSYHVNASKLGNAVVVPLLTALLPASVPSSILDTVFAPLPVPDGYVDHFGLPLSMRRGTVRANAQQVVGLRPHIVDMSDEYASITAPVELVHGAIDTIVPLHVHAQPLSGLLPDADLTILATAGHMPQHSHEDDVIAAVKRCAKRAGLR